MAIDLRHMLKVYNYVNDEKRPKVNLKFLGFFAALAVAIAALAVFTIQIQPPGGSSGEYATQTEFVGLSATEIGAGLPSSLADSRLDAWKAQHPDVEIVSAEPVYDGTRLIGYQVTYRE